MKKKLQLVVLFSFCILYSFAQYTISSIPDPKKQGQDYFVSNPDRILSANTIDELNSICRKIESKQSAEVAIVVIDNYKGDQEIFDFTTALFRKWGIGKKGKNNGLLLLIAKDRRKYQFITGYGLEASLTDYQLDQIGRQQLVPNFKSGDYDQGVLSAMEQVKNTLLDSENTTTTNNEDLGYVEAPPQGFVEPTYKSNENQEYLPKKDISIFDLLDKFRLWLYGLAAILFLLYIISDVRMQKSVKGQNDNHNLAIAKSIATYLFTGIFIIGFPIIFTGGWMPPILMVIVQGCIIGSIRFTKTFNKKENEYLDIVNKYENLSAWYKTIRFPIIITPTLWSKAVTMVKWKKLAELSATPPEGNTNYTRLDWDSDMEKIKKILSKGL